MVTGATYDLTGGDSARHEQRYAQALKVDGTLVDSMPDLRAAPNEMLRGCVGTNSRSKRCAA